MNDIIRNKNYTTDFETYRASSSVNQYNQEIKTDALNLTGKGKLQPLSGAEIRVNDKYEARTTHRLFAPVLDIVESDTIKINSSSYNIDLVQNFSNDHLEVILIQRK